MKQVLQLSVTYILHTSISIELLNLVTENKCFFLEQRKTNVNSMVGLGGNEIWRYILEHKAYYIWIY
jgi:hypothetical protein